MYVCMHVCITTKKQRGRREGKEDGKEGGGRAMKRIKINKNIKRSYIIITMSLSCIFRKEF